MDFKIGDKVSFLNEKGSGVIVNILSNFRVLVENQDGFEISVPTNELVSRTEKSAYTVDPKMIREKDEHEVSPPALEPDEIWEVDLHLDEILETGREMTDHEKLTAQIKYFHKCMSAAIAYRIRKIIFIHGVGKGTLKSEISRALKSYERTRHFDAPFKKYGYGATLVEFA